MTTTMPTSHNDQQIATSRREEPVFSYLRLRVSTVLITSAIVILTLLYYAWTYKSLSRFARVWDDEPTLFCDFVRHYYPAGRDIFASGSPVEGFFYSAFFAMCLHPISRLALPLALHLWTILQLGTTALLILIPALRFGRQSTRDYYLYLVLALLSVPMLHNLKWGQVSIGLTLCILGTMYLYMRGWKSSAAILLALACAVKFYPALFGFYFLLKRQFRLLAVFVASLVSLLVVIPVAGLGVHGALHFHQDLARAVREVQPNIETNINSQYFPAVMLRYVTLAKTIYTPAPRHYQAEPAGPESRRIARIIALYDQVIARRDWNLRPLRVAGLAILAANLALLRILIRRPMDSQTELAFTLLFLSVPFVVDTSWPHYFVYLPFCQATAYRLLRGHTGKGHGALLALFWVSVLLASTLLFNTIDNWILYSWPGCLFWSNTLLLVLLYILLIPKYCTDR